MDNQARPVPGDSRLLLIERVIASDKMQASVRKSADDLLSVTRNAWLLGPGFADGRS